MDAEMLYLSGEVVHAGDRVQYRGTYATVVFVSDGVHEESQPGYEENTGSDRGIILCDDDGSTQTIGDPDDQLVFFDRG